ncbi:hypothetical protein KC926_03160 [Candidatus Kaiserbacteria bacterium]|nr:hypothetical protein [Candidatus Kaiserbacteria bacterium]
MINLIPPLAKKSLLIEYWVRVATVWLMLISVALLCSAAIMWPAFVLIDGQVSVYETSAAEAMEKTADYKNVSKDLVLSSQQAKIIVDERNIDLFSEYIDLIESLQTSSISVSQITLSREGVGIAPIRIVGIASDRQALASFRDRLLEQEIVKSVDLPISSLASDKDAHFSITVVIAKPESV